ncbi:MAG: ribosome silencing factor [Bacteroidota bacterium]|nr:ribosome silencing factor [Bacteroidota bacterium]
MGKTKRIAKAPERAAATDFSPLVNAVITGIKEKKGHEIIVMDLKPTGTALADYFIICHGDSHTQVDALARSVEEEVQELTGERPVFKEGHQNAEWILLDYIHVVVHVFLIEQRDFYGIERFWADAETHAIV